MLVPSHVNQMEKLGCGSSGGSGVSSEKLEEMQKQLEEQQKQIDSLKTEQSNTKEELEKLRDEAVTEDELEVQKDFNGKPRTQTVKLKET